jgi:hypothetical protein
MTRPVSIRDGVMTKNSDPDLFSTGRQSSGKRAEASKPTTPTHILPEDLENSLAKLSDGDFYRLLDGVLREQKRRQRGKPVQPNATRVPIRTAVFNNRSNKCHSRSH